MRKVFDNYIFDLYGTLIDIHTDEEDPKLWEKMADYIREHFETEYESKELRTQYLKACKEAEVSLKAKNGAEWPEIRIEDVWVKLVGETKTDADSEGIRKLCIFFRESSRDKLIVYEGVIKTLDKLKEMGKGIFLLSNAQRAFTEKELADTGLTEYFDEIFISSDKGIKKPQKEFMELLLKENHLNPDKCVMIGNDLLSDVGVAFKNGINSVFLNTYDYSDKKIDHELTLLGIKGSKFMPLIVEDGDIRRILED